jgi:RNA polymerase sigma-70 factor (ECF subfamily)
LIFRAVEDADLITRVRKGDVEAFNLLVSRWEKRVFNYLLRLTGSPEADQRRSGEDDAERMEREPARSVAPELTLAVAAALDRLSPEQREAVVLKVYQGFKFEEMAEILAIPVSTIKSRLYTALDLLKIELSPTNSRGIR